METHNQEKGCEWFKTIANAAYRAVEEIAPKNPYHNLEHNLDVANTAWMLAKRESMSDHDAFLAWLSGVFHDAIYEQGKEDNEERSAQFAKDTLLKLGVSEGDALQVYCGIIPTKVPQCPKSRLEECVCDADIANMGRPDFPVKSEKLRTEWGIDPETWTRKSAEILHCIRYRTEAGRTLFEEGRLANIRYLEAAIK